MVMLDQRLLPTREVYRVYSTHRDVARAIKDMVVRGAPAIGVAAAFGVYLGVRNAPPQELPNRVKEVCKYLATSRPTAVNLFWALERIKKIATSPQRIPTRWPRCRTGSTRWARNAPSRYSWPTPAAWP